MSLAAAIAEATGLNPEKDFLVEDASDGLGPVLMQWDTRKNGPAPTPQQLEQFVAAYEAKQPQRDVSAFIATITNEYVTAMIANDLLQDSGPLTALIAKVEAWKSGKK